ncbi:hypothetical protein LP418_26100 [Nocardioides sp. B-3]|nr:hypothetical protein [Nocardioides sp. B-3]UUZ59290.1 hypothetical protein LP418_26100 [Nocardioides sp. B-3]
MRDLSTALPGAVCVGSALLPVALGAGTPQAARAAVSPSISVAGASRLYPAFDPAVSRYAVHAQPDGTVGVNVSDAPSVWFNGVPDADGSATFTDAQPGDEISVFIGDGTERRAYALYVLQPSFPKLSATTTGAALQAGNIALTIDRFDRPPRYETIVDRNGVPTYTREHTERVLDLKLARSGRFTVRRPTTTLGRTGGAPRRARRPVPRDPTDRDDGPRQHRRPRLRAGGRRVTLADGLRARPGHRPGRLGRAARHRGRRRGLRVVERCSRRRDDGARRRGLRPPELDRRPAERRRAGVLPPPQLGLPDRQPGPRRARVG